MLLTLAVTAWAATSQASDSAARARVAAELVVLSDSLSSLRGTIARANRDLPQVSRELLSVRARDLRTRCASTDAAAARLDSMARRESAALTPGRSRDAFRRELRNLRTELARCREEWGAAADLDSLRAWAPHRLARLDAAARRYVTAAGRLPEYPKTTPKGRVGMRGAVDSQLHNRVEISGTVWPTHV